MTVVTEGDRRVSIAASASGRGAQRAAEPSNVTEGDRRLSAGGRGARRAVEPSRVPEGDRRLSAGGRAVRRPVGSGRAFEDGMRASADERGVRHVVESGRAFDGGGRTTRASQVTDFAARRRSIEERAHWQRHLAAEPHVARGPRARPGAARVARGAGLRPVGAVPGAVTSCAVRPAARPLRALLWVGVLTAVVVVGLALLGTFGSAEAVPSATKVVQVQSGQTLSEIAASSAPDSDHAAVIARIEELNGLSSTSVDAGQPLVVPVSGPAGR